MKGCEIKLLRERSETKFSNREMAQLLGINERTLINWENSEDELSQPYQIFLGQIFEDVLISVAQEVLNAMFKVVPAEHLALWFYLGHQKVALFRNSARHENVSGVLKDDGHRFMNDEIIKDLADTSLTTSSIAYAVTINDAGEGICHNKHKAFFGNRYVHYLSNHTLESILKMPRFMKGPEPLYLFSAENKLEKTDKGYKVIESTDSGKTKIFTEQDVAALTAALDEIETKDLVPLLKMFYH